MLITRTSMLTGREHTLDLPVTDEQIAQWRAGAYIQDAMPHLTASQREFLMTGSTDKEWDAAVGKEEWESVFGEGKV